MKFQIFFYFNSTPLRISLDKGNNDIANILLNRKEIQITEGYFFGSHLNMIEIPKRLTKIAKAHSSIADTLKK